MERVAGIEPASPPWKGGVIAVIRYPQRTAYNYNKFGIQTTTNYGNIWNYGLGIKKGRVSLVGGVDICFGGNFKWSVHIKKWHSNVNYV